VVVPGSWPISLIFVAAALIFAYAVFHGLSPDRLTRAAVPC
jgi:hypothetical protein